MDDLVFGLPWCVFEEMVKEAYMVVEEAEEGV